MNRDINFERAIPGSYQQIPLSTSTPSQLTVPAGAKLILIRVEAQGCRYRDDGVAPTSTVGFPLSATDYLEYTANKTGQAALSFIASTAGSIINVLYYSVGDY